MRGNTAIDTIHDDDLADEALDRGEGGKVSNANAPTHGTAGCVGNLCAP